MILRWATFLVLGTTVAAAQAPVPPPATPPAEIQALQSRVMQEIGANLQCQTATINLQQENTRLKVELERLKAKPDAPK